MRDDQYIRLQQLEEKLTDAFLFEADPDQWPGKGVQPKDLTQHERGDRFWCKKNAVATITMCMKVGSLLGMIQRNGGTMPGADGSAGGGEVEEIGADPLEAEIASAEAEANKLLRKLEQRYKDAQPQQ